MRGFVRPAVLGLSAVLLPISGVQALVITVSGVINANGSSTDNVGLFGPPGASLVGAAYELTINTDPLQNPLVLCATTSCNGRMGGTLYSGGAPGAAYTLTMTVDSSSFSQVEQNPLRNDAYRIN